MRWTIVLTLAAVAFVRASGQVPTELPQDPLALLSSCTQSTTAPGSDCNRAINNVFTPSVPFVSDSVCSQTNAVDGNFWWQAQLSRPVRVTFVRALQLQDCCNFLGYKNLEVTLDGNDCQIHKFEGQPWHQIFYCNRTGQVLRIRNGEPAQLTLCSVRVFVEHLTNVNLDHPQLPLEHCSRSAGSAADCHLALDGSIDQNFDGTGVCQYINSNTWLQVQTPNVTLIKYIRFYSQMFCCVNAEISFTITVDGTECVSYAGAYFTAKDFLCNKTGQTIRINVNAYFLSLCEIQAFGEPESKLSVSFGQQIPLIECSQSSVVYGGICAKAMDSSTNQTCSLCSRTQIESGWWQARTARLALVTFVKIFLSTDCCFEEHNNITVTVDGKECAPYDTDSNLFLQTLFCNETGRVVRVTNLGMSSLALCEVQVFGELSKNSSKARLLPLEGCSQSSIASEGCNCQKAIVGDSISSHVSPNNCNCSRTKSLTDNWWQARTSAKVSFIKSVIVKNQPGSPSSRYLQVTVDGQSCLRHQANVNFSVIIYKCDLVGRLIRVSCGGGRPLALCEVSALGWPVRKKHPAGGGRVLRGKSTIGISP